jgi:hypothetical protein
VASIIRLVIICQFSKLGNRYAERLVPFAYRRTTFVLGDMDDTIKFLIAVGQTGRENIETLQLSCASRADSWHRYEEDTQGKDRHSLLPELHVSVLVMMLKQCKRLRIPRLALMASSSGNWKPEIWLNNPP